MTIERDRYSDMDPNVLWEMLFNYLNDMTLILRRIEKQTAKIIDEELASAEGEKDNDPR